MRFRLPLALGVASLTAAAIAAAAVAPASAAELSVKDQVLTDARTSILAMATKSSATDTQYLENGRFRFQGVECYRCEVGPAVAAAALWNRTGDAQMRSMALDVLDTATRTAIQPNGTFGPSVASEGGNGIQTLFFAEHLGAAMYYLGDSLDAGRKASYTKVLTRAADYLVAQGLLSWYVNGNINLAITMDMGLAYKYSGQTKYRDYYEKSLAFTLSPTGRFAAYGLKTINAGARSFGMDTAAYLAEGGAGGVGFDPDYTQFQADIAAQGYQVLGDKRLLTLTNQLNNALLTKTDTTNWALDVKGTRHPNVTGKDQYQSPAMYIGAINGKSETKALALSQVKASTKVMRESATQAWPGIYQAWGTRFAVNIFALT